MANIYTRIQRKINRGEYEFLNHSLDKLRKRDFDTDDALSAIRKPFFTETLTDDESNTGYVFAGRLKSGRMIEVIVFINQNMVQVKTAYEIFK